MKYLHHSSSVIQAAYRGHLARRRFARIVSEQVNCMKRRHYDVMATKIQTRWRGYYTRKYKHNYYARKAYLRAVQQRNYDVRHALRSVCRESTRPCRDGGAKTARRGENVTGATIPLFALDVSNQWRLCLTLATATRV